MDTNYSKLQLWTKNLMGFGMVLAGTGHLTFARLEFQAQVPTWLPIDKDFVVVASGIVEVAFGLAMIFWNSKRREVGWALAVFYILVFPGNISQYVNRYDAFGLNTDNLRLVRLFFQPVLILAVLWSTGALTKRTGR